MYTIITTAVSIMATHHLKTVEPTPDMSRTSSILQEQIVKIKNFL
jgi:hypothetical protein